MLSDNLRAVVHNATDSWSFRSTLLNHLLILTEGGDIGQKHYLGIRNTLCELFLYARHAVSRPQHSTEDGDMLEYDLNEGPSVTTNKVYQYLHAISRVLVRIRLLIQQQLK